MNAGHTLSYDGPTNKQKVKTVNCMTSMKSFRYKPNKNVHVIKGYKGKKIY